MSLPVYTTHIQQQHYIFKLLKLLVLFALCSYINTDVAHTHRDVAHTYTDVAHTQMWHTHRRGTHTDVAVSCTDKPYCV